MNAKSWARNLTTGKVVLVPPHYLTHPVFSKTFIPAEKGDKDYLPEMYKSKTADEFKAPRGHKKKDEEALEVPVIQVESIETPEAEGVVE